MRNTKPFVQAASVCERILVESDGVASLIRLVDVFHIDFDSVPKVEGVPPGMEFSIFISLKSGDLKGSFKLGIRLCRPEGKAEEINFIPVTLNGGGHGANIRMNGVITNPTIGLHWFDLLWADEILTRIPLEVKPKPAEK